MNTTAKPITAHPLAVRHAALVLWTDAFWNDDADSTFWDKTGKSPNTVFGQQLMDRPTPLMPESYVAEIGDMILRVEKVWGRTVEDVAAEMETDVRDLASDIAMECCGFGVGPEDRKGFPASLKNLRRNAFSCRENPAHGDIPDFNPDDFLIEGYHPAEYASFWGDDKSNAEFYNFYGYLDRDADWYFKALGVIEKQIQQTSMDGERQSLRKKNLSGLRKLYELTRIAAVNATGNETIARMSLTAKDTMSKVLNSAVKKAKKRK